jgi:hypothetical protein
MSILNENIAISYGPTLKVLVCSEGIILAFGPTMMILV